MKTKCGVDTPFGVCYSNTTNKTPNTNIKKKGEMKMNTKLLKGIEEAIKGLNMMAEAIKAEETEVEAPAEKKAVPAGKKTVEKKAPAKTSTKKTAPVDEEEEAEGEYTYAQLMDMKYNDMKKYAKSVGVTAMGSREKIVKDILATYDGSDADDDDAEEEEAPAPKKKTASAPAKKSSAPAKKAPAGKKAPVEEADEEEEDEAEEEDDISTAVREAVEDMEDSDISELLKQSGLPCKGKRAVLIDRVIKAAKDGVIDLDDEDEDTEEEAEEEVSDTDEEESVYDSLNDYESNEDIPDERIAAIKSYEAAFRKKVKAKTMKTAVMKKALISYYGEDTDFSDSSDEEIASAYLDMKCRFIDDEGESFDGSEDAYYVNGMLACHGYICEESEDGESLVCPACGAIYEM